MGDVPAEQDARASVINNFIHGTARPSALQLFEWVMVESKNREKKQSKKLLPL